MDTEELWSCPGAGSSGTQQASCSGLSGPRVCSWDEICPRQTQQRRAGKTSHPRLTWNQIRSQATCSAPQWGKEAERLPRSALPQKTPRNPLFLLSQMLPSWRRCTQRLSSSTCAPAGFHPPPAGHQVGPRHSTTDLTSGFGDLAAAWLEARATVGMTGGTGR